jgi:hypothetical protein
MAKFKFKIAQKICYILQSICIYISSNNKRYDKHIKTFEFIDALSDKIYKRYWNIKIIN